MKAITPYLFFAGNCKEAMSFYQKCFEGDLNLMTYGDGQGKACHLAMKNQIMHAYLRSGDLVLMASDAPNPPVDIGTNVQLLKECQSVPELEALFKILSEKGETMHAPHDAFWGARFAVLKDRFGVRWMLSHEYPKK